MKELDSNEDFLEDFGPGKLYKGKIMMFYRWRYRFFLNQCNTPLLIIILPLPFRHRPSPLQTFLYQNSSLTSLVIIDRCLITCMISHSKERWATMSK